MARKSKAAASKSGKGRATKRKATPDASAKDRPQPAQVPEVPEEVKIRRTFTALEREGIMGLLDAVGSTVHPHWVPSTSAWRNDTRLRIEFDGIRQHLRRSWKNPGPIDPAALFGEQPKEVRWGYLMSRAFHDTYRVNGERVNVGMVDNFDADLLLSKWRELFIAEVGKVLNLWPGNEFVRQGLSALIDGLSVDPLPQGKSLIAALQKELEGAQLLRKIDAERTRIVEHLKAMKSQYFPEPVVASSGVPLERIPWQGSTIEFITIMENLVKARFVDLPSKGGKGDGNWTEYFRRLQQAFDVPMDNGHEFTAEGLANRRNGRPMGDGRASQFTFPEASRKKTVTGK